MTKHSIITNTYVALEALHMKLNYLTLNTVHMPKKQHEIPKSCQENVQQRQLNDTITTDQTVEANNSMMDKYNIITNIILRLSSSSSLYLLS